MPTSKKKWFYESRIPGKRFGKIKHCFLVDKLIFQGKSPYQDVLIFDNSIYGRILILDGIVQLSEKDECIYHEMMVHPVLFSHPKPENILIIGGGDGGVLREVLKHPIKKVDLIELDQEVIKFSQKYLPFMEAKKSFSNQKVKTYIEKGEDFIKKNKGSYDIVIVDCTNPSPGSFSEPLYSLEFYTRIFSLLTPQGIIMILGASFLDLEGMIKPIFKRILKVFPKAYLFRFTMPSYHCGEYCFIAASQGVDFKKVDFRKIEKRFKKLKKNHKFKYYSPEVHRASMVLPKIWQIEK